MIYLLSAHRYPQKSDKYFTDSSLDAITNNFNLQIAKLGNGLLSGDYSKQQPQSSSQSDADQYVVSLCESLSIRNTVNKTGLLSLNLTFFSTGWITLKALNFPPLFYMSISRETEVAKIKPANSPGKLKMWNFSRWKFLHKGWFWLFPVSINYQIGEKRLVRLVTDREFNPYS